MLHNRYVALYRHVTLYTHTHGERERKERARKKRRRSLDLEDGWMAQQVKVLVAQTLPKHPSLISVSERG